MKLLVFTGGGTGGHIYPGLAVIDELQKKSECRVVWVGSSSGIDRSIVASHSVPFIGVPSGKLRRYLSLKNIADVFRIAGGFFSSLYHFMKLKPQAVFSKGGFVSVPPCYAARVLGIPVYTHECDFSPGLATKLNARVASRVLVSYEETASAFPAKIRAKVTVTGNPVRPVFYSADAEKGRKFMSLPQIPADGELPVLLVLGGSQGARQINELIAENLEWLCRRFIVVHQTGEKNDDQSADISSLGADAANKYKVFPYIREEMPDVLAAASLVLARSGANTVWECAAEGKPMLLIPLCGSGTRGDQVENADYFVRKGAAVSLAGEQATSGRLKSELESLSTDVQRVAQMARASSELGRKNAAAAIAELLISENNIPQR